VVSKPLAILGERRSVVRVNAYLIQYSSGESDEIEADGYEREGDEWVFILRGEEVARFPVGDLVSISKYRV
jgi:hypothetical protein